MRNKKTNRRLSNALLVRLSLATFLALYPNSSKAQNISCSPMNFGEITTCGAAGTVTVNTDNSTSTSCVTVGGAPSRSNCLVSQSTPPFRPIQISITTPTAVINSGANNMNVNAFHLRTNAGPTVTTVTGPFFNIPVGATLNVGASQASGSYGGSFGITAVLQ